MSNHIYDAAIDSSNEDAEPLDLRPFQPRSRSSDGIAKQISKEFSPDAFGPSRTVSKEFSQGSSSPKQRKNYSGTTVVGVTLHNSASNQNFRSSSSDDSKPRVSRRPSEQDPPPPTLLTRREGSKNSVSFLDEEPEKPPHFDVVPKHSVAESVDIRKSTSNTFWGLRYKKDEDKPFNLISTMKEVYKTLTSTGSRRYANGEDRASTVSVWLGGRQSNASVLVPGEFEVIFGYKDRMRRGWRRLIFIPPDCAFRIGWDLFSFALVIYLAFAVPVQVFVWDWSSHLDYAYITNTEPDSIASFLYYFDIIVVIFFFIDRKSVV